MALNQVLLTLAGLTMAADFAVVQSPNIDDHGLSTWLSTTTLSAQTPSPKVSVQFKGAKVSEVLSWLQARGFSFVVNDSDVTTGKTITLSVKDQSVRSIANAVASALGGHWEDSNGIHVFKKGDLSGSWMKVPSMPGFAWGDGNTDKQTWDSKAFEKQFGPDFQKGFEKQFGPDFQEKLQKDLQKQFGPDFQKNFERQFGKDYQKNFDKQFAPDFQKNLEKQFGPDFQEKLQKDIQKQFGPDFQKNLEKQFGQDYQKNWEKQLGPEFQQKLQKDLQKQLGPDFEKRMEKMGKDWELYRAPDSKKRLSVSVGSHTLDPAKILRSLTPDQKDKQRKVGYVWFNDLTPEQKQMFDGIDGKFDIQIKIEDDAIRIRRN